MAVGIEAIVRETEGSPLVGALLVIDTGTVAFKGRTRFAFPTAVVLADFLLIK